MSKIDRNHCASAAKELNETNDCVVRALAVATEIPYKEMHEYLAACGRKPRDGVPPWLYHKALKDLGYKLTKLEGPKYAWTSHYVEGHHRYYRKSGTWAWVPGNFRNKRKRVGPGKDYNAATVTTLAKELTEGTYLVGTNGHVACLKNGEVHDWTKGRRHRVEDIYRVEESTE
jgi:hypothetical protein